MLKFIKLSRINLLVSLIIILTIGIVFPWKVFAVGNEYKVMSIEDNVPYNKVWTIKMSTNLKTSTVNSENVIVMDSLENKIDVSVHIGEKDSEIIVEPPAGGYEIGEKYYLQVTDTVLSSRGYKLDNNVRLVFTIEDLPVIDFCKIDREPVIEGQGFGIYMNTKTNREVQYNVYLYNLENNKYKNITTGYTQSVNGKEPMYIKYDEGLDVGKYKLKVFIKRTDAMGAQKDSKLKIYYDNFYEVDFQCVKNNEDLISVNGEVKFKGEDYAKIEGGYLYEIGDEITLDTIAGLSGISNNYLYKFEAYNLSNVKDIKDITDYEKNPVWIPEESGNYILEVLIKSYKTKENEQNSIMMDTDLPYDAKLLIYINILNVEINYVDYDMTFEEFVDKQGQRGWGHQWVNGGFRNANRTMVEYYANPENFINDEYGIYQFLKLNYVEGFTVEEVNLFLEGMGILEGQGEAFLEASKQNNINPAYLIAHAMLETGRGTSKLSTGVTVSSVNGKPVEPRVVYNMYGIKAYNKNPIKYGSEYAYEQGWFTPEAAIMGGQTFIGENYINSEKYKQDTLYKIRWSSEHLYHQYATDVRWAYNQTNRIKELLDKSKRAILIFEIPVFKK